jgi:dihydrolipoamide dehydrogenase
MNDLIIIGAGPAGVLAALRGAELGARTLLVARKEFGGMAANDGPVPVRVLAHAARLIRDARQLGRYGVTVSEPVLDYPRLLARVREVVREVRASSCMRQKIDELGAAVHENAGAVRFTDPHTIVTESGQRLQAEKFIICTGGVNRGLPIPGFELTSTHSDAWSLESVPPSMLVIGAGNTGVQVASIFNAFGSRVELLEANPRILPTEDEDVAKAVAAGMRESGMVVRESFGVIECFEKAPRGVRMNFSKEGRRDSVEASLVVMAVGWVADTARLNLGAAGVELDRKGFVTVDEYLRTSAPHIFAAGDVTGRVMLVPEAIRDGFLAATNAVQGTVMPLADHLSPAGSFTDPEYASVGLTEKKSRETHDVVTSIVRFDSATRTIIDGRKFGFCKLIADRKTNRILGCHVTGERAVDIVQVATIAMAARMSVDELARVALSFPTYARTLVHAAADAAQQLNLDIGWQVHQVESINSPIRRTAPAGSESLRVTLETATAK